MKRTLMAAAGLGLAAAGVLSGTAGASDVNLDDYSFVTGAQFASDPNADVMTWQQATITLPAQPTWTADGQEVSGWLMGGRDDTIDTGNWNQVGWVSYGPNSPPYLYEETSVNGVDTPQVFGQPLQWGATINVALSCDTGTGIWQDWGSTNSTSGLTLISTQWTMDPCNDAVWSASMERFDNGASTFPTVGPESITNRFADLMGDDDYPSDVVSPGMP